MRCEEALRASLPGDERLVEEEVLLRVVDRILLSSRNAALVNSYCAGRHIPSAHSKPAKPLFQHLQFDVGTVRFHTTLLDDGNDS